MPDILKDMALAAAKKKKQPIPRTYLPQSGTGGGPTIITYGGRTGTEGRNTGYEEKAGGSNYDPYNPPPARYGDRYEPGVGSRFAPGRYGSYDSTAGGSGTQTIEGGEGTKGSAGGDYPDWLKDLMGKYLGEGTEDWEDIERIMQRQYDAATRQYAEAMGSRGMTGSGAMTGGLGQMAMDFASQRAKAYMDYKDKQFAKSMQVAQLAFQDLWKRLDYEHQQAMAKLMYELDRKAKYGEDYKPNIGDYEMQMILDILAKQDIDEKEANLIKTLLTRLGYGGIFY